MAKQLELLSLIPLENGHFKATGTVNGKAFFARTVLWKGLPIFKIQETNSEGELVLHQMKSSHFDRGERFLKAERLKVLELDFLSSLTLKQLRAKAKELGVRGTHRKGITKTEVRELVKAAA
jgi:hypothetical protein